MFYDYEINYASTHYMNQLNNYVQGLIQNVNDQKNHDCRCFIRY